eukprot:CAMPEP_0169184640 /NCGR_PEP_ID=MMETSP1016-20121227/1334_1 /TAXON_ID=342587 /ORGANISM="Karlodinium micrum, Strain CCMP2283" /LENGTH=77 /DNA_ID=CAMNT_0009260217 /DNA_START=1123 /DNA_END=1352 /DNA_ORIENTATION=+
MTNANSNAAHYAQQASARLMEKTSLDGALQAATRSEAPSQFHYLKLLQITALGKTLVDTALHGRLVKLRRKLGDCFA